MLEAFHVIRILHFDRLLRLGTSTQRFLEYFKGLDRVEAVRKIFGEKTEEVLSNLKIGFTWLGGYMWVNGANGHVMVSARYMNEGNKTDIYLDIIHELVHVRQFLEGKELFDERYSYINRPTEVEAYSHAVEEARRLGLSDKRICEYLKTEWMSDGDVRKLAWALGVICTG